MTDTTPTPNAAQRGAQPQRGASQTELADLETRVIRRWAEIGAFRPVECRHVRLAITWCSSRASCGSPYPAKRTIALLLADRLLDKAELTDYDWLTICHLVLFGGRVREA